MAHALALAPTVGTPGLIRVKAEQQGAAHKHKVECGCVDVNYKNYKHKTEVRLIFYILYNYCILYVLYKLYLCVEVI